jgi:hypothetical protein
MSGKGEPYTCANCGGRFTKGCSDEEAMSEALDLFPVADLAAEPPGVVCDDCYQAIMAWARVNMPEHLL